MKVFNETTKLSRLTRSEINMVSGGTCECYSDLNCKPENNIGHGGGHRGTLSECMDSCKTLAAGSCKFNEDCYHFYGLDEQVRRVLDVPNHFLNIGQQVGNLFSNLWHKG